MKSGVTKSVTVSFDEVEIFDMLKAKAKPEIVRLMNVIGERGINDKAIRISKTTEGGHGSDGQTPSLKITFHYSE